MHKISPLSAPSFSLRGPLRFSATSVLLLPSNFSINVFCCFVVCTGLEHPAISSTLKGRMSSYQVIARKYRPQRFSEVVGQEHVTQTLANAITQKRIAHAYLFVGPRGTGKTTIARIFAKCLNCTNGPAIDFPDDDQRANEITEGRSLDVLEIDGASNRGIDEIRELRDTVKYAPASSRYKIYIIDEVHMLTKEAFNALLKTLEEPPEHVKFMFATTEPEKILPTILSRCQRFDLRRIPASLIVKHLGEIAAKEKVQIDEAALFAVARGAEGGMRDAESTLDQLISFCGDKIQESDVLSMFGLAARAQLLALTAAILNGSADTALRELNDLARNGKDLGRLLSDLLAHFRNLMIFQVSKGDLSLLDVSEAELSSLKQQSATVPLDAVTRVMEVLTDAEGRLRDAASKKIFLEVTLLKAIEARNALSIDAVLKKLQQLRSGEPTPSTPPPARAAAPIPAPAPAPAPVAPLATAPVPVTQPVIKEAVQQPPQFVATTSEDLEPLWSNLVEAAGRASPFIKAYLLESHPVSINKSVFTLGFDPMFGDHMSMVDTPKNRAILETKLRELGQSLSIKIIQAEAPPGRVRRPIEPASPPPNEQKPATAAKNESTPASAPTQFSKEDFKNDPLIRKALDIFKGTIVEVRA
jgi:DNA polymerase III subunit gamma/tau